MTIGVARLLSAASICSNLSFKTRLLASHVSRRYIQEFPEKRFDNSVPKDYLLVLPEKLNETDNELLRLPQRGESEIDFMKLDTESCFKGLSQALCTFENFITDVNNQVSTPYNNADELFRDVESHLYPLDSAYNILMILVTVRNRDFAYKEIVDIINRYYTVRRRKALNAFYEALKTFSFSKNLTKDEKCMLKLYNVKPCHTLRPFDESSISILQDNLENDCRAFNRNLHAINRTFTQTIDDPDILAAVSSDFDDCKDLHHKERTPLQITTGTYHKFMQVCPDRFVRQRLWQTYNRRCSPKGLPKFNNIPLITAIRVWRRRITDIAGYRSHLDYRLGDTMAGSRKRVMDCLQQVSRENLPKVQGCMQELTEFAYDNGHEDPMGLREHDVDYWTHRYIYDILIGFSETELKKFFPFENVMIGLQNYFKKYFSVEMRRTHSDKFWSKHVQLLELTRKGEPIGSIIYDPFYRSANNPYETVQVRLRSRVPGSNHLPARFLSTPFEMDDPSSGGAHLTAVDTMGLFHCFSSVIQELLYNHKYYELNSYGLLEHDVRELVPRLCLAHIQADHTILQSCSMRKGGKPIDSDLIKKVVRALTYSSPLKTSYELYKAHLDHESHILTTDIKNLATEIYAKYVPLARDPDNYDYCGMDDIFVGPNDGIQYSGLWSTQLAKFCLDHNCDSNGNVDDAKIKEFFNKLIESLYISDNTSADEKLTALVGKRFEPSEAVSSVL